jgi:hypothetical protein
MPRSAKSIVDIKSLARAHTETCIRVLAKIVTEAKAPASARAFAANSLLDRGWGKAPQQLTGEDGGDIRVTIRQILVNAAQSDTPLIEHDEDEDGSASG